jgi:predicted nucleotidyltransferase
MQIIKELGNILPYLPKDKRIISVTEVGSGMWGMRELSSDYDIVVIYSENMADFIAGRGYTKNLPFLPHIIIGEQEYDFSYMEVGHLINLLKKGNINAIWATLSPLVFTTSDLHRDLADYLRVHPTKAIMPSLEGMVMSQLSDASKRAGVRSPEKSIMTAMRTVRFGQNLLVKNKYLFNPVRGGFDREYVEDALSQLKLDMVASSLCDKIPPVYLENTLLKHRMIFLKEDFERRDK